MPKQIIIAEQHQIAAVFWEDQIQEIVVSTGAQQVGDIYLGIVENVIPGIDAAFVNIGDTEKNGFIHVSDLGPIRLRKNSSSITELLEPQQKALVQVMKEPTGNKGPRLTGNITLPGRYVVLMPYSKGVNLSRRISSDSERNRLRALAVLMKPPGMGLLVRTEAEGTDEEAIIEDLELLQKQWEAIQQQANYGRPPTLINRDDDFIQRVLRDMYSDEVNRIVVDSASGMKRVKSQLMNWQGGKAPDGLLIDHHREKQSILDYFRVNAAIREALKPRVELPSGGYIIIEPTEALTVIDVNSGSFTKSATARETVLWTNYEAATEIARQLRLRNIGGVIVVDFIDMDSRHDQLKLLEHFTSILRADKARPQIAQLSELGLVELTRKRQGQNIYELFGQPCAHCNGIGHLVHLPGEEEAVPLQLSIMSSLSLQGGSRTPGESRPVLSGGQRGTTSHGRRITSRVARSKLINAGNTPAAEPLNLVHHPDYQEQGGNNNNNNRRRRRRTPEVSSKPVLRDEKETQDTGGDRPSPETPTKEKKETKTAASSPDNKNTSSRYDRRERSRYRRDEPKETVQVEMTEQEKNVYALIGVSPLVRLDAAGKKDPRSTIIEIVRPGTVKETDATPEKAAPDQNPEPQQLKLETSEAAPESDTAPPTAQAVETETKVSPQTEAEAAEQTAEEKSNDRRRRRRRSSASS
ncbi:ribonuclease E [Picosynechococcus sp. PCC 7003]|uniref:Rne/Rng family ribonuclease n=1 Tax=Picosynechococcus sp. PCC 7003 TaxID=374981 RepID=UPI000810EE4C|nr:Rne/Rng family ribonuclease [Picosynechococcus sp. PCC 7003]ANV83606.1 ribonuclease E [Picosynechococcus sp. PCC 7003]